ncbi:hypothetical protein V2J09_023869 [Rumex salicifolius]
MGKQQPSSCFKFIACGRQCSVEDDTNESPAQANGSAGKCGWSFRKRSGRRRVLSNNLTSENLTNKETSQPQSTSIESQTPTRAVISEKVLVLDEKHQPPTLCQPSKTLSEPLHNALKPPESFEPELNEPKTCDSDMGESVLDSTIHEEVVVVVSEPNVSAELKPSKTVVSSQDDHLEESIVITIQAGVRGFLAQREVVKLRSTVKLQAAIRGHLVRRQAVDTLYCIQGIVKIQLLVRAHRYSNLMGDGISLTKPITPKSSTKELLENAFARRLLESTPKSKSSTTKCDPLKPDSAWTWLEIWTDISSSRLVESEFMQEAVQSQAEKCCPIMECEDLPMVEETESINSDYGMVEDLHMECEDLLSNVEEKVELITHDSTNVPLEKNSPLSDNLTVETQECELPTRNTAFEQADVDSNKSEYGSRKASNPSFLAARSKFQVLSSTATSNISSSASLKSPGQDIGVQHHPIPALSLEECVEFHHPNTVSILEESSPEAFVSVEPRINVGGSECGTELSVTSTLDSPDHEDQVYEMELKTDDLEVKANGHSNIFVSKEESPESNGEPKPNLVEDSSQPEHNNGEYVVLNMIAESTQETVKTKRNDNKVIKSKSNKKHITSNSAAKRTVVKKSHQDSSVRELHKDQKGGKRRKCPGSTKSDTIDQEPRDSISSVTAIPSYMQATKSAKAKVNNAPRSSPDVQEKDYGNIVNKRHSLPNASGKHGSPRAMGKA